MKRTIFTTILSLIIPLMFISCSKKDDNETDAPQEHQSDSNESDSSKGHQPEGVKAIDLGLPSGTKWANMNVGATKPEEYGCYYAWGETEEKDSYDYSTYIYNKGQLNIVGGDIAGTEYDVAHVKWGGSWRMPYNNQIEELIKNCWKRATIVNNVYGYKFTGPNGNSIFLPAARYREKDKLKNGYYYGYYWSSTRADRYDSPNEETAYILFFSIYDDDVFWGYNVSLYKGLSVRPVCQ